MKSFYSWFAAGIVTFIILGGFINIDRADGIRMVVLFALVYGAFGAGVAFSKQVVQYPYILFVFVILFLAAAVFGG